jgi:hypothetical protein
MKHGVEYAPRAVVATPTRAAPSVAVAANLTGCTGMDANDPSPIRVFRAIGVPRVRQVDK